MEHGDGGRDESGDDDILRVGGETVNRQEQEGQGIWLEKGKLGDLRAHRFPFKSDWGKPGQSMIIIGGPEFICSVQIDADNCRHRRPPPVNEA
jgi:hypothetical protein